MGRGGAGGGERYVMKGEVGVRGGGRFRERESSLYRDEPTRRSNE